MPRSVLAVVSVFVLVACSTPSQRMLPEPEWPAASALERDAPDLSVPGAEWPEPAGDAATLSRGIRDTADLIHNTLPDVCALLILKGASPVYEQYFGGADRETSFNVKSVTKSVVSALTGVAIADGVLPGLDTPVSHWLPEASGDRVDPRVNNLTLRHLLSMSAGFQWQENGPSTTAWMRSPDYVKFTLESPLDAAPGERFNYSTAVAHLVSVILTRASGMSTKQFAQERLFGPIGARAGEWATDPQGYHEGRSELHLTARDMARFGLLYLNQGRWNGRAVVPRSWVLDSTRPHKRIDYGLMWPYLPKEWGGPVVHALGYGGQLIAIVPDANVVIVIASTIENRENDVVRYLREVLLPAVR